MNVPNEPDPVAWWHKILIACGCSLVGGIMATYGGITINSQSRVAALEVQVDSLRKTLDRIENKIDNLPR